MKPKKEVRVLFKFIFISLLLFACNKIENKEPGLSKMEKTVKLNFSTPAVEQDEEITREAYFNFINDINLFVFDENGNISQHFFITDFSQNPAFITTLKKATFYAVANWGSNMFSYQLQQSVSMFDLKYNYSNISELVSKNIFTGKSELLNIYDGIAVNLELIRSFAKLTVCFDKTELSNGVDVNVKQIEIKNSPNTTSLFSQFKAMNTSQIITSGDKIASPVIYSQHELAQPMSLAENMQGYLLPNNNNQILKVLTEPMASLCTYVEITADYHSAGKKGSVKYRIYLGKDETRNFDIKRNTWYKLTVKLKGSTLNETSWRLVTDDLKDMVTSINLSSEILEFDNLNETQQLTASVLPASAFDKSLTWSSTNPLIATVNQYGNVTSTGYGNCRIIASSNDGSGISDTVNVNVKYVNPIKTVTDIILSPSNLVFTYLTTPSQSINASVLPADAANKNIIWESSNNSVAIVDQAGVVSQTGPGMCTIRALAQDGSNVIGSANIYVNYAITTGIEIVEDYNSNSGITTPAKTNLVDSKFSTGIRGVNNYKVKVLPFNANQNVTVNWSMSSLQNNSSLIATLTKLGNESANLTAKDLINVSTNRGKLIINASVNGYSTSIEVHVYEKIPLRIEWGSWMLPGYDEEVEGIVPRYAFHNSMVAPLYLPEIAIIGNSGVEYWGAQLGNLWINPALPDSYNAFINEFSQSFIHPGSEFNIENNCFYSIEH